MNFGSFISKIDQVIVIQKKKKPQNTYDFQFFNSKNIILELFRIDILTTIY